MEAISPPLSACAKDGRDRALRAGALPGAISAPNLAVDDAGPNCLLSLPVCGVEAGLNQEPEPLPDVPLQMLGQPFGS